MVQWSSACRRVATAAPPARAGDVHALTCRRVQAGAGIRQTRTAARDDAPDGRRVIHRAAGNEAASGGACAGRGCAEGVAR